MKAKSPKYRGPERREDHRKWSSRNFVATLLAIACVAGMTVWVYLQGQKLDTQQTNLHNAQKELRKQQRELLVQKERQGTQYRQLVEACDRLNILRAEDNVSHYADYQVFTFVYLESKAAENVGNVPKSQLGIENQFLQDLHKAIREKSWTPLTNCTRAVQISGLAFRSPLPVPFYKHLPAKADLQYSQG